MFVSLVGSAVINLVACLPGQGSADLEQCWKLDKSSVMSGGCLSIVLDDMCSALRGLELQIDDRAPVPLMAGGGVTIQQHHVPGGVTTTYVLISHHFLDNLGLELIGIDPETYRMKPVFDEPGAVRLTLLVAGQSLGAKVVTVATATPEAQPAVNLLFPTVIKDQGPIRNWAYGMTLLAGADQVPNVARHEAYLPQLKRDLEILRRHPDWAEIFEMLIARLEARIELSDLQKKIKTGEIDVGPESEPPPAGPGVAKALETKLKSSFAKAIQSSIREVVGQRRFYLPNPDLLRSHDE